MEKREPQEMTPQLAASLFLNEFQTSGTYRRDLVEGLAVQSSSDHPETSKAATGAIFTSLVERLADSFEPKAVTLYNRVFAQLIQFCRQTAQGERLDKELAGFGLLREEDAIARAERLRHIRRLSLSPEEKQNIRRAIVLSRVTIGADVAITSVLIERLKNEFCNAEIVLLGGSKTTEIFGGDARVRFAEIQYRRAGSLTERLSSWLDVLHCVRQLIADLGEDEYLIADPDSRLTQLGLLPLLGESFYGNQNANEQPSDASTQSATAQTTKARIRDNYIFFPSRELGSQTNQSLSELTTVWLDAVFGREEKTLPRLCLRRADSESAKALVAALRQGDERPIVAINFGVGENPAKRLSEDFEKQLLRRLLQNGMRILFDKGFGEEEIKRADAVLEVARQANYQGRNCRVIEIQETGLHTLLREATGDDHITADPENSATLADADVVVWQGRIGLLAALIAESDLYIGYDSAGQHIASAVSVPCIDVFAGFNSPRMLHRWRPTGKAESRVLAIDTPCSKVDVDTVLSEALRQVVFLVGSRQ
jgi:ADP-heptose:LPS heptosyltransferase